MKKEIHHFASLFTYFLSCVILFQATMALGQEANAHESKTSEKSDSNPANSSEFKPSDLISFFGIKSDMKKEELDEFKADMKDLIKSGDVLIKNDRQSNNFYQKAILFSKKFKNKFPVGMLSKEALEGVHITKDISRDLIYEMRTHSPENGPYNNLGSLCVMLHVGAGYLSLEKGKYEEAIEVLNMGTLMNMEHYLASGFCFQSIKSDAKKARLYGDFLSKNAKFIESIEGRYASTNALANNIEVDLKRSVQNIRDSIAAGNKVTEKEHKSFIDTLAKYKQISLDTKDWITPINNYEVITRIWEIKSIMHSLKEEKLSAEIMKTLEEIKNKSTSSVARRWAGESLLIDKEKICKRYLFVKELIISPDGEIQGYKDLDGKPHEYSSDDTDF